MVNRSSMGDGMHCTTAPRIPGDRPIEHGGLRGDGGSQQSRYLRAQRVVFPRNPGGWRWSSGPVCGDTRPAFDGGTLLHAPRAIGRLWRPPSAYPPAKITAQVRP
jgi:hypothetical protein